MKEENPYWNLLTHTLKIDCGNCCALCCAALWFSRSEGFPADKAAGNPCTLLAADFRCSVHGSLAQRGLTGCMAYDCFGAGQKTARDLFAGTDWRTAPDRANRMYAVFLKVFRLHQMLWYLAQAAGISCARPLRDEIGALISENERFTREGAERLAELEIEPHHRQVSQILQKTGKLVRAAWGTPERTKRKNYPGKNFKGARLDGRDFSMSLLIASSLQGCSLRGTNFLGADLRDADVREADFSESVFLTQGQLNAARGNRATKLPPELSYPAAWNAGPPRRKENEKTKRAARIPRNSE